MKKPIAIIVCTALLAGLASTGLAQFQRVEAKPAEAPEALEPPEPPEVAVAHAYEVVSGLFGSGANATGRALIIPKEAGEPKGFAEMEEDLNVMARILEKATTGREGKSRQAMGIHIYGGVTGSSVPKNLYIEGHGALFFLNVNFPLLPPATQSADAEPKDKTSTEWETARRELYRSPGSGFEPFELHLKNVPGFSGPAEEYDADTVEELKRDLTTALKNGAHIRNLKSEETVTVIVSGRSPNAETRAARKVIGGARTGARTQVAVTKDAARNDPGTRLILRARKADIEAFQKDDLTVDEFRKQVTVITY